MIKAQVGICEMSWDAINEFGGMKVIDDPTGRVTAMPIIMMEIDNLEHQITLDEECV